METGLKISFVDSFLTCMFVSKKHQEQWAACMHEGGEYNIKIIIK